MMVMRRGVFYLLVNHACLPCTTLQPSICLHTEMWRNAVCVFVRAHTSMRVHVSAAPGSSLSQPRG